MIQKQTVLNLQPILNFVLSTQILNIKHLAGEEKKKKFFSHDSENSKNSKNLGNM